MAAAAAHAHSQHKRGDANGSHLVNPLMTALMQDDSLYGTEVRRRSWLEKVFIALRGPLHEVEQSHVAQMHDFWSARDAADDTKEDYFSEARARAARARSSRARAATPDAVSTVASDHLLYRAPPPQSVTSLCCALQMCSPTRASAAQLEKTRSRTTSHPPASNYFLTLSR